MSVHTTSIGLTMQKSTDSFDRNLRTTEQYICLPLWVKSIDMDNVSFSQRHSNSMTHGFAVARSAVYSVGRQIERAVE